MPSPRALREQSECPRVDGADNQLSNARGAHSLVDLSSRMSRLGSMKTPGGLGADWLTVVDPRAFRSVMQPLPVGNCISTQKSLSPDCSCENVAAESSLVLRRDPTPDGDMSWC